MLLSPNQKRFSEFFSNFWNLDKIEYFEKKDKPRKLIYSKIRDCKRRGYLNAQKSRVAEYLWTVNMLNGPEHCKNLRGSIFVIFSEHYERKAGTENLF